MSQYLLQKNNYFNKFTVGDILSLSFRHKGLIYFFEGLCIAIKGEKFVNTETAFIIRNILSDVGIELNCSFFFNRMFSLKLNNFKRKKVFYPLYKLYYVRNKLIRESRFV